MIDRDYERGVEGEQKMIFRITIINMLRLLYTNLG
jgi:hypothetical protein